VFSAIFVLKVFLLLHLACVISSIRICLKQFPLICILPWFGWIHLTLFHPRCFSVTRVADLFSFLCCPIMCLYVLSYVFLCLYQTIHTFIVSTQLFTLLLSLPKSSYFYCLYTTLHTFIFSSQLFILLLSLPNSSYFYCLYPTLQTVIVST
jgi:hypothetical protein